MFVEHKEAMEVTEAPAKITKLSQAMREGAKLRPQGYGVAFAGGKSCAWGAAWEGLGNAYDESLGYSEIAGRLSHLHRYEIGYGGGSGSGGNRSIACLNDQGATREQIADWLEAQGY